MAGIQKINSQVGGINNNITGGNIQQTGNTQQTDNTQQTGNQEKTKEQVIMEKAQKLVGEYDKATLDEALKEKNGGTSGTTGQKNSNAQTISSGNDLEVIEKAVEIKEQEEATQNQQASQAGQQNEVSLSQDAMTENTGQSGTIPQAAALQRMV